MQIMINGDLLEIEEPDLTILQLLTIRGVEAPEMVSVQLNGEIIDRDKYGTTGVAENDEVEFLFFMGGGDS